MRIAIATLLLCLHAATLYAQSPALKSPDYKKAVAEALQEFAHGNYPEARAAFERAHAVAPNARTLRGMGLSAFESRDYVGAIQLLSSALAHPEQPLTEAQRTEAIEVITRAQGNVATIELELSPSTAALLLDGQPIALQDGKLSLNPGEYRLEAHAADHESLALSIEAKPGHTQKHTLVLQRPGRATPLVLEDGATAPARTRSIGPYVLAGSGGLLLLGSAITGALTAGAESDLRDSCKAGRCDESARDSGKRLQVMTNVLLPLGAGLLAGGVVWWILDTPRESQQAPGTQVLAACSGSGCGVEVHGNF